MNKQIILTGRPDPAVTADLFAVQAGPVQGFVILDHGDKMPAATEQLSAWLKAGKLSYREDIVEGLENAPSMLVNMLAGQNQGKALIRVGR